MSTDRRPHIGVPYRARQEEIENKRPAYDKYLAAIRAAGGEPVEVPLGLARAKLDLLAETLDAVVLPGSPRDVDPAWYHAERHPQCAEADPHREQADFALLDHAFAARKPVLAICYGVQSLNVYLGGALIQDIASEIEAALQHDWTNRKNGAPEPFHPVRIEAGTQLVRLVGAAEVQVNSSHHQAIDRTGRGLRVTAHAPDGVIEAVEGTQAGHWVMGVQWHPERLPDDSLTRALFNELVAATRRVLA